jgi:hypothetical protein
MRKRKLLLRERIEETHRAEFNQVRDLHIFIFVNFKDFNCEFKRRFHEKEKFKRKNAVLDI